MIAERVLLSALGASAGAVFLAALALSIFRSTPKTNSLPPPLGRAERAPVPLEAPEPESSAFPPPAPSGEVPASAGTSSSEEAPVPEDSAQPWFLSIAPEEVFSLEDAELRELHRELDRWLNRPDEAYAPVQPEIARSYLELIRANVVPQDATEKGRFWNVCVALNVDHWVGDRSSPRARGHFADHLFGSYPSLSDRMAGKQLWARILRVLRCELSPDEELRVTGCIADAAERKTEVDTRLSIHLGREPPPIEDPRFNFFFLVMSDLRYRELAALWSDFETGLLEAAPPEKLLPLIDFFRALGVWKNE